jgi:Tol biopolymer transport system component
MNANGTDRTRLTDLKPWSQSCKDLVWSPDGQHIAFTTGVKLWVMNADGTNQTQLTDYQPYPSKNYAEISRPIWSPDGQRIAYVVSGTSEGLYVMNVDGTNRTYLGRVHRPTWAP